MKKNSVNITDSFVAVVLAAGQGKRMKTKSINKTVIRLAGKPMIGYTVDILRKIGLKKIIIVVGYAKQSVIDYLGKNNFIWAEQKKQLGTADAVKTALAKLPPATKHILVIQADDSAFYRPGILKKMIMGHLKNPPGITFLTVDVSRPDSLGRVIRNKKGKLIRIVEAKNATASQLKIKEINAGCYCFKKKFLYKYLNKIKCNPVSGEYYLPDLIGIALKAGQKIKAVKIDSAYFCGINTPEELVKATDLMKNRLNTDA